MDYFSMRWRLCACRVNAGYTQKEAAKLVGVSEKPSLTGRQGIQLLIWRKGRNLVRFTVFLWLIWILQKRVMLLRLERNWRRRLFHSFEDKKKSSLYCEYREPSGGRAISLLRRAVASEQLPLLLRAYPHSIICCKPVLALSVRDLVAHRS